MRIFIMFCLMLPVAVAAYAKEGAGASDTVIGSAFKTVAKAYVLSMDVERFKKEKRSDIMGMDEKSFRDRYFGVLSIVYESPQLQKDFGMDPRMDRHEALRQLESLDKKKMSKMIDSVPNEVIARRFRMIMSRKMEELKGVDLGAQVRAIWETVRKKFEK